jgi:hypothetical protein
MAGTLWDQVMETPGDLSGSNSDRINTLGQRFYGSNYQGTTEQNINLYNNIKSGNFGAPPAPAPTQAQPAQPAQPQQVTPYLNTQQQTEFEKQNQLTDPLTDPSVVAAKTAQDTALNTLNNTQTAVPTAPKLEESFNMLKDQYDVQGLESDLNNLKSQEQEVYARLRMRTTNEKGQRVGMGVIGGRVNEITNQEREELDFVQRQITTRTNQVQSAYSLINTIMNFKNTDFNNAMQTYTAEFNKNVKMYELAKDNYRDIRDFSEKVKEHEQDTARANLQIYANMITTGSMNWNQMDSSTQLQVSKLEVQAGLGMGFVKNLQIPLNARIKEIGTRTDASGNKYADMIITNLDGSMKTQSVFLGADGDYALKQQQLAQSYASSSYSSSSKASSAAADGKAKALSGMYDAAEKAKTVLRKTPQAWGEQWNSLKLRYGLSNQDTDLLLGVPRDWIASGKPGWEWWNKTYGNGI